MLKRVLVANRGEIAVRIIRECLDCSIEAVAVYSTADEYSLHAAIATDSVCIGSPRPQDSYLNMNNITEAAKATGCEAIHPVLGSYQRTASLPKDAKNAESNLSARLPAL